MLRPLGAVSCESESDRRHRLTVRLRNTLTRRIEPVEPLSPGRVRMYTCGPTVYRWAHVGNLRSYLLADFIRRALLYHGLDVVQVKNITDVGHLQDERFDRGEDRMLVQAHLEGRTSAEIAAAYEAGFHADEARVNILPAQVFPRASEHVAEMIHLAERLEDRGFAYATPHGTVYYAVERFPGYGRLSGNSLDELRAGHRVEVEPDKRDPADFALWKPAGEGRELKWRTPRWGEGFPGWHLECSAMALRYLGAEFDIHTGGVDNVFPHHEDEIAQTSALTGRLPARLWVHGEHLLMAGRKMAKSAGNFQRITELAERGIDPLAFRYLALTVHYGHKLNLSDTSLTAAARALDSLSRRLARLGPPPADGPWAGPAVLRAGAAGDRPIGVAAGPLGHQVTADAAAAAAATAGDRAHRPSAPLSPAGRTLHERFVAAVDADLDLPGALAAIRDVARSGLPPDERRWLILDADAILGLDLDRTWAPARPAGAASGARQRAALEPALRELLDERAEARRQRDFARADSIRTTLSERGVEVIDLPDGTTDWRPARGHARNGPTSLAEE